MFSSRTWTTITCVLTLAIVAIAVEPVAAQPDPGLSQLGGWVYVDRNNDGSLAFSTDPNPEFVIGEVSVSLYSVLGSVESLLTTIETDDFGRYLFENINPGTYTLRQTQPIEYVDGRDTLGLLISYSGQLVPGAASVGTMEDNAFLNIVLTPNVGGEHFNFGERGLAPGHVSKRDLFATLPPNTPPPPPPQGEIPEPASVALALIATCTAFIIFRRRKS